MPSRFFYPPVSLARYISAYEVIETPDNYRKPYVLPPQGFCGLHICLEGKLNATVNGNSFMPHRYCANGQVTAPVLGIFEGRVKCLNVLLQPCGLYKLFGVNMAILTNTSVPLADLLGNDVCDNLIAQLMVAKEDDELIALLNLFFSRWQPLLDIAPSLQRAIDLIHEHHGSIAVKTIERHCYITSRSLERQFKKCVGISPKDYTAIYRFRCLIDYIRVNPGATWARLCAENGYYDQAHLTRYFNRYLNLSSDRLLFPEMNLIGYSL